MCSKGCTEVFIADFGLATTFEDREHSECGSGSHRSPGKLTGLFNYVRIAYHRRQNASTRGGRARRIRQDEVTFGHSESFWSTCCSIAFLRDSAFFHESFPFSSGTIDILLRIFVIRPGERITLSELRGAILRLDTFFLSREVLCHAPKLVRDFASWKHPDCDSLSKERLDSTSPASNRPPVNLHSPDDFLSNAHRKSRPRGLGKITLGRLLGF